jgi:hypothetical protein
VQATAAPLPRHWTAPACRFRSGAPTCAGRHRVRVPAVPPTSPGGAILRPGTLASRKGDVPVRELGPLLATARIAAGRRALLTRVDGVDGLDTVDPMQPRARSTTSTGRRTCPFMDGFRGGSRKRRHGMAALVDQPMGPLLDGGSYSSRSSDRRSIDVPWTPRIELDASSRQEHNPTPRCYRRAGCTPPAADRHVRHTEETTGDNERHRRRRRERG